MLLDEDNWRKLDPVKRVEDGAARRRNYIENLNSKEEESDDTPRKLSMQS